MQIIQNVECVEVLLKPTDNKIKIYREALRGKKINAIYLFASTEDNVILSPFDQSVNTMIVPYSEIPGLNLYLNAVDNNGKNLLKDIHCDNLLLNTERARNIEFEINSVIDIDNLFLNSKSNDLTETYRILVYIFYQNDHLQPVTDEITGSFTCTIPVVNEIENIRLFDIIGNQLNDLKIRDIKVNRFGNTPSYLNLISKNGKRHLENIPLSFFGYNPPRSFIIDPLTIDAEKSFLLVRSMGITEPVTITFFY